MQDKFNFFIPATLVKGTVPGQEMKIKGICSSEVEDVDGETLVPAGYDLRPLLETGFLNYNHQANKTAAAIIGEPTVAEIINNGKDLYIEGFLYADSEEAKAVYKLATTLEKNSSKRRLGFSIEGKAMEKDPLNPKRITKAKITGVAITAMPKNPNTLLSIMKGEYSEAFVDDETIEKSLKMDDLIKEYKDWTNGDSHTGSEGNIKEFFENYHEDNQNLIPEFTAAFNKAMTATGGDRVTSKESVEGGIKHFDKLQDDKQKDEKKLKKSEVYDRILAKYADVIDNDIQKAKQIYQLTQEFNTKLYNMDNNNGEVISKALDNCFQFIDSQIDLLKSNDTTAEGNIEKGAEGVEAIIDENAAPAVEETPVVEAEAAVAEEAPAVEETPVAEGEVAKSEETEVVKSEDAEVPVGSTPTTFDNAIVDFVKSQISEGLDSTEIVDEMVMKGMDAEYSANIVKSCTDAIALEEERLQKEQEELAKGDISNIGDATSVELIKSQLLGQFEAVQTRVIGEFQTRFEALGKLIKSQSDDLFL